LEVFNLIEKVKYNFNKGLSVPMLGMKEENKFKEKPK